MGDPHLNYVANIFTTIVHYDIAGKADNTIFLWASQAKVSFGAVTYKNVYEELLRKNYIEHHSVAKWEHKFSDILDWEKYGTLSIILLPLRTQNLPFGNKFISTTTVHVYIISGTIIRTNAHFAHTYHPQNFTSL